MDWKLTKSDICPTDLKSLGRYQEYKKYYMVKHNLCMEFQPDHILEIGVRAGYSALAFLSACPDAHYVGLDAENGKHGGANGPWMWWAKEILAHFDHVRLKQCDTQKISELDEGEFDFVHIDGDHSFKGALHDMNLCWPHISSGGVMLVDDYDYISPVKKAIDYFRKKNKGVKSEYRNSLRGEYLFFKP